TALQYGARGRHMTKAAAIAEVQMEALMRSRWTDLAPTNWTAPVTMNEVVQGPANATEQAYNLSWRITDADPSRTRSIDVLVTWVEPKRRNRQYAITSLRFNHEVL